MNIVKKFFNTIRSFFLHGVLTLLPIALTFALFATSYRLINTWLEPIYQWEPPYLQSIPGSEIALVLLVIFLVGAFIKIFFLEPLIHFIESFFFKIPLMRPIYGGIKQLVQAFTIPDKVTFQQVVYVHFPHKEMYSLGFLSNKLAPEISPNKEEAYFNVFIPTTPNPTSGFLVQIPERDIIKVNLTRQEAMSLIISGGIIQPDRLD